MPQRKSNSRASRSHRPLTATGLRDRLRGRETRGLVHPLLPLIIPLLLIACTAGTDPGPCEEMECRRITDIMIVHRGVFRLNDSLTPVFTAEAVFGQRPGLVDQHLLHGGSGGEDIYSVELNGIDLRRFDMDPPAEGYSYRLHGDYTDSVLAPQGEWNRWVVRRGFDDSAHFEFRTPNQRPALTIDPTFADDTLSSDRDLHITWPDPARKPAHRTGRFDVFRHGRHPGRLLPPWCLLLPARRQGDQRRPRILPRRPGVLPAN